jgi:hypothetical protein
LTSWRSNVLFIVTVSALVCVGAFAVLAMTGWSGGRYLWPAIGPLVLAGGQWWYARTRSLYDVAGRPTDLEASQEIVARGLSASEAMDLAIRAMLEVPGARLVERGPEQSWGRTATNLRHWGEFCVVTVVDVSPTRLRISSRPTLNSALWDWRKNRKNVKRIVAAMQQLHPEVDVPTS